MTEKISGTIIIKILEKLNSINLNPFKTGIFLWCWSALCFFARSIQRYYTNSKNLRLTLPDYSYYLKQPQFKIPSKVIRSGSHT
jgi:hypothetical protein